ncbi:MAG TPA: efflux RND transporter permease subunit, partial [Nitrospiraceae bacterium]|nr:efflux RND transporter permease subunit [Nitrospiraceae bacterium]
NLARYCVENRAISGVMLIAVVLWGIYGFLSMPQRKDPNIPSTEALAVTPWPGVTAEKIEQLVTRQVEDKIAENPNVHRATAGYYGIKSMTLSGRSFVWVNLEDSVTDTKKEFNDINLKLKDLGANLPDGSGPVQFKSDFGDTAALMLTVASPKADAVAVSLRAHTIQDAIVQARGSALSGNRLTIVYNFPLSANPRLIRMGRDLFARFTIEQGVARDLRFIEGPGFVGVDAESAADNAAIMAHLGRFFQERLRESEIHPDAWMPVIIRDPKDTEAELMRVAGDKYTYRELDDMTDLIQRTLQGVPQVSKVTRSGVLQETIYLNYSQERLAAYGIALTGLSDILRARNITQPGGMFEIRGKNLAIAPSGEFQNEQEIGGVLINLSSSGASVYLRDLVDLYRGYEVPKFLNVYSRPDHAGGWERTRAVTLAVQMRPGDQIGRFGQAVDAALADLKQRLPDDLVLARTSDQPRQVEENVHLFMDVLMDAVILVILVSWIGFWEWRSALLMALAIPITLAITFGMMNLLGIDIQQVSIASLIIALGLLVDDPVVAGDAIKRDLATGHRPVVASWLGPTKLATVILYATITNIVAYLPFLLLTGKTGQFLYSLPVVIACSLVASRLVSMTFIPFLGYYLLRPTHEPSLEERKRKGFVRLYYKVGGFALDHRWAVFAGSLAFLALGLVFLGHLKTQFFPKDLAYLSHVNVWLPTDSPLSATSEAARRTESLIIQAAADYAKSHAEKKTPPREVLRSLTTFIGGGAPRFWYTLGPEQQQLNYAQIIMEMTDKHDTTPFIEYLQPILSAGVPGARAEALQLESAKPVGTPVAIRVSGEDIPTLRRLAEELKTIFRSTPTLTRIRDDWGEDAFTVRFEIDPDRANLAGVSNLDIAASAGAGISGYEVTTLREGHRQIPVVLRLRMDERAQLGDLQNLYVFSSQSTAKVPLGQVSTIAYQMEAQKLRRREHFRTITAEAYPLPGVLSSEAMRAIRPQLADFQKTLPPGYQMQIGGEEESQVDGFRNLAIVMAISIAAIFLALVFQFKNAVKPLLVFAAIPYGMVGALAALYVMQTPFGFMAFMGVASLVGVIVSHIIVLFEFIEERHALGEPFREAMLDSGILRLRPVLITVGATVIALFPLAYRGGPLWEPMCYTQIGGLLLATIITKILVPVLYAIFVLDLKILKWETKQPVDVDGISHDGGSGDGTPARPAAALPAAPAPS